MLKAPKDRFRTSWVDSSGGRDSTVRAEAQQATIGTHDEPAPIWTNNQQPSINRLVHHVIAAQTDVWPSVPVVRHALLPGLAVIR